MLILDCLEISDLLTLKTSNSKTEQPVCQVKTCCPGICRKWGITGTRPSFKVLEQSTGLTTPSVALPSQLLQFSLSLLHWAHSAGLSVTLVSRYLIFPPDSSMIEGGGTFGATYVHGHAAVQVTLQQVLFGGT